MQPQSDTISNSTTSSTTDELRSDAKQVGTTAVNRVHSELDARKGDAANQARSVSSAIERASGELDDSVPQWLRSAFQQGAQQVQRFADALEQKDSRELISEVRTFARDYPGTFLAGCAAAGFAAARIFKAGSSDSSTSGFSGQSSSQGFQGGPSPSFPSAADPALPAGSPGEFV